MLPEHAAKRALCHALIDHFGETWLATQKLLGSHLKCATCCQQISQIHSHESTAKFLKASSNCFTPSSVNRLPN